MCPKAHSVDFRERSLTLGAYADVSLKRTREKRDDARRSVADGINPSAKRRAEHDVEANTFVAAADTNGC
jgi:Arm DNA-binding domain